MVFAKYAKSSAALVNLGIHALLIVAALSFVAVTVSQKEHVTFEAMQPNRSKLPLRKLQVQYAINDSWIFFKYVAEKAVSLSDLGDRQVEVVIGIELNKKL